MEIRSASEEEIQKASEAALHPPLVPIGMDICSCATKEEMHGNFYATLERGYEPVNGYLASQSGKVCIVGAGPSLEKTYKEIEGDVCAINSSIAFLLDQGIVPKWAMLWDAAEIVAKFATPHPEITYLVASRCHPKVFERLKDCKVVVWHAGGDHDIIDVLNRPEVIGKQRFEEPLINGGSAGVTRAIFVMMALGYTAADLFGADSSYSDDRTHVRGSLVPEKNFLISLGDNPPTFFRTTPEWMAQVEEYKAILTMALNHEVEIRVFGEGLLPAMHERLMGRYELLGKEKFMSEMALQVSEQQTRNKEASRAHAERLQTLEGKP